MRTVDALVKRHLRRDSRTWRALRLGKALPSLVKGYSHLARQHLTRSSIFDKEWQLPMCSLRPTQLLDKVLHLFRPASVLDVGCGTGQSLEYLLSRGVDAFGIEGSALAISRSRHRDRIRQADLNQPVHMGRRFDLTWSFEVAEHIHPKYTHHFVNTMSTHSDLIVMTAAQPGQGGEGHFNEQPAEYWIDSFGEAGFEFQPSATKQLRATPERFSENVLVFHRRLTGSH